METCFVIQPFDKGKFDKRYTDIFEPAIRAVGLEPYRVDRDPAVRIPIDQIEDGIRKSKICFAEITLDNPNVWYELGFAFALDKDVVMVTEERQKFPFDIQHRHVINYSTASKSDYELLERAISDKLRALLEKQSNVQRVIENPVKDSEGLKAHQITMLIMILENQITEEYSVSAIRLQRDMESAGFTKVASNIAFRELLGNGMIQQFREYAEDDPEGYIAFKLTKKGENWLLSNQDQIEMRNTKGKTDDLPF